MSSPSARFPWWYVIAGAFLAAVYVPTLATPFDFIDDGNLVYPTPAPSFQAHMALWWERVQANYEHLGPFRPTLWVHWQLQANLFEADPFIWRTYRLIWCALAAGVFVWLLRELGAHPAAAIAATALAMWNPYRNEIWTSLTLAEGVAMPYALFALIAARSAAHSQRPLAWEVASALAVLVALGCKNTFAALVPAQILLRMWPAGLTFRDALRLNGWRSLALGLTLLMPATHYVYFKQHWHFGQYETHAPSIRQLGRILSALKGAMSPEIIAAGLVLAGAAIWAANRRRDNSQTSANSQKATTVAPSEVVSGPDSWPANPLTDPHYRPAIAAALLLLAGGVGMYLPMDMMSGRYTMPAVWGLDITVALLLTAFAAIPSSSVKRIAWAGLCAGLAVVAIANIGRQEKFAARAHMLWDALHYVEATAPPDARIAWLSGDSLAGELNEEEGIHFQWHLYYRDLRRDIRVGLYDTAGRPLDRVEITPLGGAPQFALYGKPSAEAGWQADRAFTAAYWLGRRRYDCHLSSTKASGYAAMAR